MDTGRCKIHRSFGFYNGLSCVQQNKRMREVGYRVKLKPWLQLKINAFCKNKA